MKDNARQVPGSTPSRRTPFVSIRVDSWSPENPAKMPPKCRQKRECHFFNDSASGIYNFDPQNWSHFPELGHPLLADLEKLAAEPCVSRKLSTATCCSFSLGEKVRMRDKLVSSFCVPRSATHFQYCTKLNKTERSMFSQKSTTLYQRLTTAPPAVVRFCRRPISEGELRRAPKISHQFWSNSTHALTLNRNDAK
jgi:hypothetical protein